MEMMETVEVYEESEVRLGEEVESSYTLMEVTSPKRKKRNKNHEDNAEKQKKPRSAYLLYYFDVHQSMQQEYPSMPQSEINKRISESWRRLNVADKAFYLERAKQEKEGVDTKSPPSQDLSGFRKILPRANYVLLPRSHSSQGGLEPQECPGGDEGLALGGRVELVQSLRAEDATVTLQGGLPSSSPSAPTQNYEPQNSTGVGLLLMGEEPMLLGGDYSTVGIATEEVVQQVKGEAAHLVTLLPGQSLLEPTALPGASTVGAVVMVPVAASGMGVDPKPSFKMAVKTYTRRGRGRCQTVGCPYVYVTRHKPLSCPSCGRDLGGKWMPSAKKTQGKKPPCPAKPSSALPQSSAQGQAPDPSLTKPPVRKRDGLGCRQNQSAEEHAVTAAQPLEGITTYIQTASTPSRTMPKSKGQERSSAIGPKRPMRPILPAYCNTGRALLQCITVPSEKGKTGTPSNSSRATTALSDTMSALKPSTLKQLGQAVPVTATLEPSSASPPEGSQYILTDNGVKRMSVVPLSHPSTPSLDLGLSTARGRGRCKNPSCDYVYKNRHKPAECPCCGWELSRKTSKSTKCGVLLDPYGALSAQQRELQRQSTLQLLRSHLQIPESEAELRDTLSLIQELNSPQEELSEAGAGPRQDAEAGGAAAAEAVAQHGWPRFFESAATHCGLCHYPLFKGGQSSVAGQEDCWLLTESLIQTASLQLKVCLNTQCLALHSFTHLHPGLFNIGNRLLVSVDLFLKIRGHVRLGQNPSQAVTAIFNQIQNHPVHGLTSEESQHVHELLVSGYWAFECLTVRDYNDMICGVCGIAPKVEISQRYTSNVLELKHVEFTWPEFGSPDEVRVDDFWLTMEREALEQAAFPSDVPVTRVDASIIAPFLPPLCRSSSVINTEKDKLLSQAQEPAGDPSALVRLIHEGHLRPEHLHEHSEEELRAILEHCGQTAEPHSTQDELLESLVSLYTRVQSGLPTSPQPPPHLTAGKLSKVCPHQVVCGSKFLVRGETARDHVDLLLSSRFWPPVYATDAAQQVALCTDMQYPELAFRMWGWNQGCFSDPTDTPQFVSCAELQDQPYSAEQPCLDESGQVHPVTRSASRWLVHPTGARQGQERYAMGLCTELEPFVGPVAGLFREGEEEERTSDGTGDGEGGVERSTDQEGAEEKKAAEPVASETGSEVTEGSVSWVRSRPQVFHNAAYYYLYNRLTDFLSSRDIVAQQIGQVLRACQPGQVVIRDALYRLGVAQINTEGEEAGGEGGEETVYEEVVLP